MIKTLTRLFGRPAEAAVSATSLPRVPVEMHWLAGTQMPIPDWERMGEFDSEDQDDDRRHAYWNSTALTWLEACVETLGPDYGIRESDDFLLLSAMEDRPAQVFLNTCQRMLARINRSLGPLADNSGWGKYVVMVFAHPDDYYHYIGHYYPEGGEYAMSSGMFIQAGYGHFVMPEEGLDAMEPVIAHELTHCLLTHLPIPAWLNEGIAVNTEHQLFPQLADPRAQLYFPHEVTAQHAAYWDEESIQAFWSGKSFLRTDDGNRLSYDLATKIAALAARNDAAFRTFVANAHMHDGGVGAEHHLGFPIANLAEAVLGEGPWQPRPETWQEGVERGQF